MREKDRRYFLHMKTFFRLPSSRKLFWDGVASHGESWAWSTNHTLIRDILKNFLLHSSSWPGSPEQGLAFWGGFHHWPSLWWDNEFYHFFKVKQKKKRRDRNVLWTSPLVSSVCFRSHFDDTVKTLAPLKQGRNDQINGQLTSCGCKYLLKLRNIFYYKNVLFEILI